MVNPIRETRLNLGGIWWGSVLQDFIGLTQSNSLKTIPNNTKKLTHSLPHCYSLFLAEENLGANSHNAFLQYVLKWFYDLFDVYKILFIALQRSMKIFLTHVFVILEVGRYGWNDFIWRNFLKRNCQNPFKVNFPVLSKPVKWFALQFKRLVSLWWQQWSKIG